MTDKIPITRRDVLLVIDVQNDFCPGGALAVPHGDEVVPVLNRAAQYFTSAVLTQDWHPRGHISFASSHTGKAPFETLPLSYGTQTLWPDHCVQMSAGADFHPALSIPQVSLIIRKGFDPRIDSYSAFQENDRETKTGLAGYLHERGATRIFIGGLAYDFCVRYSAEDAVAAGFAVVIIEDGCRGLDLNGSMAETRAVLAQLGCTSAKADDLV